MFNPKYTITPKILKNIKEITFLISDLNHRRFPKTILVEFEKVALEESTFSSTSIEGNPIPLTQVKRLLKNKPENIKDSEREVLNYNEALRNLEDVSNRNTKGISNSLILGMQKMVMLDLISKNDIGKYRKEPVIVNNPRNGKIVYLPPDFKDVPALINDLVSFVNKNMTPIDVVILSGIFHKQFVVIHPFIDGNGRTARLVTKFLLSKMGLDTFNLFSFENYYNRNVSKYFENVGVFGNYYEVKDAIDFTSWLEYFTNGIIDELVRVKSELDNFNLRPESSLKLHDSAVIEYIGKHGFINESEYGKLTDRAKATRALDLKRLTKMGLIKRMGKGRGTYYVLK